MMRGWPASTAVSIANSAARGSKRTANVTSMIGRFSVATDETSSAGWRCRTVSISVGVKLPTRRTRRRPSRAPSPERHVEEDPTKRRERSEQDEPRADEDDERREDRRQCESDPERVESDAPHSAEKALVLL